MQPKRSEKELDRQVPTEGFVICKGEMFLVGRVVEAAVEAAGLAFVHLLLILTYLQIGDLGGQNFPEPF